ncbi:MAG: glycosyltransferase family 2 protein [Gemmatimonadales bacterium]
MIVPCYNTERYLPAALGSICSQDCRVDEVLVIDDGSIDGSAAIADRWGAPVRCLRQPHGGAAAARNIGLDAARGDVLAFLDADDTWTPGSLSSRLDALAAAPDAGCAAGFTEQFISPDMIEDVGSRREPPAEPSRGRVLGAIVVRRGVVERIGRFDPTLRVGDTIDWVARIDAAGIATVTIERVVLRRRIHGANMGVQHREWRADYLRMLKQSLDRRRERPSP